MKKFVIAAAQTGAIKGDVQANLGIQLRVMERAASQGVTVLVFPELSLTGYEPELAQSLAFAAQDARLQVLADKAVGYGMTVITGAPLQTTAKPQIASFILSAQGGITSYAKMHLHSSEENHFSPGAAHCVMDIQGQRMGIAICADTCTASHPAACAAKGATVYAAGVLVSVGGYAADAALLKAYAAQHDMLTLMANHNRPSGGWIAAGKSAIWTPDGQCMAAGEHEDALVIAEPYEDGWGLRNERI